LLRNPVRHDREAISGKDEAGEDLSFVLIAMAPGTRVTSALE
jgi:hypothetical protein